MKAKILFFDYMILEQPDGEKEGKSPIIGNE